jgi:two-component system chemotaxis sensor kinase CheA
VAWTAVLRTNASDAAIRDTFLFVADDCEVTIAPDEDAPVERRRGQQPAQIPGARQNSAESSTLRVTSDKIDSIIDLVGELVIAQSMVMQLITAASVAKTPMLRDAISSMTRNMQELQERVMGIRMVPISTLFGRFSRIVRDTAAELGKTVHLEIEGQETEIDKAVVERLVDPITHLVRNSLDHGLETDEQRQSAGKTEPATLRLAARHVAGGIVIDVADNGRGLNTQRIREKAQQTGLISPGDPLTDDQIHALIFEPGFSTAEAVTDLSGRGVGMDVVRRCVDSLNGTISIDTAPKVGTILQIRLPLTLAILDGLLLRVGTQTYILPLLAVVESFRPRREAVKQVTGGDWVAVVRDSSLPLIDVGLTFGVTNEPRHADSALVVVVEADGKKVGLVVDNLMGQSQVVVKSLETHYRRVDGILGATILGDGHVAFILDVAGIVRLAWARRPAINATRAA